MKQEQIDDAKRRALNIFKAWNRVMRFVEKSTGYYYELQGIIEDAVDCGAQEALGVRKLLESETRFVE